MSMLDKCDSLINPNFRKTENPSAVGNDPFAEFPSDNDPFGSDVDPFATSISIEDDEKIDSSDISEEQMKDSEKPTLSFPIPRDERVIKNQSSALTPTLESSTSPTSMPTSPTSPSETDSETTVQIETPKTTRGGRRAKTVTVDSAPDNEEFLCKEPKTTMPLTQAIAEVLPAVADRDWDNFVSEIEADLEKIILTGDITTGALKTYLGDLDILYSKTTPLLHQMRALYENLTDLNYGIIPVIRGLNISGANELERRRAGLLAASQYETDSGRINLFELARAVHDRLSWLRGVSDSIRNKSERLITVSSALKIEANLLPGTNA